MGFKLQIWRACWFLTEESVETVGKEDAHIFRARRGNIRAAGNNFEDLGCAAAVGLGVVGRAGLCIDDGCRAIGRARRLDGNGLEANADVIPVELPSSFMRVAEISAYRPCSPAFPSGSAIKIEVRIKPGVIGLDPQDARCRRQVRRRGDQRSGPTISGDAHILENVCANQEVKIIGEGIEGARDARRAGQRVEAVVKIEIGLCDGRGTQVPRRKLT